MGKITEMTLNDFRNVIGIIALILTIGMMFQTLYSHTQNENIHLCKGDVVFKESEKVELLLVLRELTVEVSNLKVEVASLKQELRDIKK